MKLSLHQSRVPRKPTALLLVEDMHKIGTEAIKMVRARIEERGQTADGQAFPPYTEAHAKRRQKAGLQTGYRDLKMTGKFLDSLRVIRASRGVVSFGWSSGYGRTLFEAHSKRGRLLGLTSREKHDVLNFLKGLLKERLAKLQLTKRY